jgi:hypothetical protein
MNYADELNMYVDLTVGVLSSLATHCKSTECDKCHFSDNFGLCLLEQEPEKYDIELIKQRVSEQFIAELENKMNNALKDGDAE